MNASVLIVDDEPNIRRMLGALLREQGYTTNEAGDGVAAIKKMAEVEADVILLDLALPGVTGLELLDNLHERWPLAPIIMMSGRASLSDAVQATKRGAFHFIEKPLTPEAVLLTIRGALDLQRARFVSRTLAAEYGPESTLIGSSAVMQRVRELIQRIARTDARVLITGESGTGKELVASALHAASNRADAPFIRVNSAAIPRELIESEMFGHEKGAFSGAHALRRGRFELADGGTLFLDEIADLSADAQAKLLRVLETGEFERVGGERLIKVDVRTIAATNRDLARAIEQGSFREDLFHRLNVIPIELPPLRQRAEDIPELIEHFMHRWQQRTGRAVPQLDAGSVSMLRTYHWPGNVRELANFCERIAILHEGRPVTAATISQMLPSDQVVSDGGSLTEMLDDAEKRLILRALAQHNNSIAEAAKHLKTDRANLYRRMRRLDIDR
ncbi:MAG TPA: sigma-54 dependent transcriptional regulator [Longimicrobiales bacterium]